MDRNLPTAPEAIGNYVTYKKVGNFVYTSGHVPISNDKKYIGKIPSEVSLEDAYKAAELCAELTISTLIKNGDIKNLQPINVIGFVNAIEGFADHAKVLNGFTDKLAEYFSEKSTRSAVGVASLPLNVCVEVQCVFTYE
jgi:enamine deaminase RidA (YjgF/YER057c/UK114 family)